jgi:hypothetical protein
MCLTIQGHSIQHGITLSLQGQVGFIALTTLKEHYKASGIYSPKIWQSFISKVDQVVENNKNIVVECHLDYIVVVPNVNLNQLHNFNKIDNIDVSSLNHLD